MEFGVNDEGITIVHLLEQLHGLRSLLKNIRTADASAFARDDG